jgi:hypothetical protein
MDEGQPAWDRTKEEFGNDFDSYLLHVFENEPEKEKLKPNAKATYAGLSKELRLQPTTEALDAAEMRVQSRILQMGVTVNADEHAAPVKER